MQQPSNQPYLYIEANTELDEEIAALKQSWLESEQLYRLSADRAEMECEQLRLSVDRTKMIEHYNTAARGTPRRTRSKWSTKV